MIMETKGFISFGLVLLLALFLLVLGFGFGFGFGFGSSYSNVSSGGCSTAVDVTTLTTYLIN